MVPEDGEGLVRSKELGGDCNIAAQSGVDSALSNVNV